MSISVLVTGVGNASTGEEICKSFQLGRQDYDITATNIEMDRMVVVDDVRKVLLPPASDPGYLEALAAVADEVGARFILPGSDVELVRIVDGADELAGLTDAIPLANNGEALRICMDKQRTAEAVRRAGMYAPRTFECTGLESALEEMERLDLEYPLILKPKSGGGGSAHVYVAQDERELDFFLHYAEKTGPVSIVQEYVGTPDHEYSVSVLNYPDGSFAHCSVVRRYLDSLLSTRLRVPNLSGRSDLGDDLVVSTGFTQGEIDGFQGVREAVLPVAEALGSTGPLNVQGRLVGSRFYVFEINPRFSGSTSVRARAGYNGPEELVEWHLGIERNQERRPLRFNRGLLDHVQYD